MFVRYTLWQTLVGLLSRLILIEFFKNPIPEIPKTRWSFFCPSFPSAKSFSKKKSPPLPSIFRKSLFSKNPIVFRSLQLLLQRRRAHACTLGTRVSLSNGASNELLHTHTYRTIVKSKFWNTKNHPYETEEEGNNRKKKKLFGHYGNLFFQISRQKGDRKRLAVGFLSFW